MQAIAKWLVGFVLEFIWGKAVAALRNWQQKRRRAKEIADEAKKSTQPLKDATTGHEIEDATDDALDHL